MTEKEYIEDCNSQKLCYADDAKCKACYESYIQFGKNLKTGE